MTISQLFPLPVVAFPEEYATRFDQGEDVEGYLGAKEGQKDDIDPEFVGAIWG